MSKKSLTYGIDILSGAAAGYDNVWMTTVKQTIDPMIVPLHGEV